MKKSTDPGPITAAKQVNSRVIPDVSSSGHMSLSTGQKYLQREAADRPANEDRLRGIPALPRHKLPLVYALGVTEEQVSRADLKPCPFCGSGRLAYDWQPGRWPCAVVCLDCGAGSDRYSTRHGAAESWNTRVEVTA